jgi:hypothetical protein
VAGHSESPLSGREIIVEFAEVGLAVKVSAMDTATLTEVCVQGPASAPRAVLERNALARLKYVLRKRGLL